MNILLRRSQSKRSNTASRGSFKARIESLEVRRVLDSTVVFNEVMYHPWNDGGQQEWIELHNQMVVDVDISGWKLDNGVQYEFPAGTVLRGRDYLVVAADPQQLAEQAGVGDAYGPFEGRISNGGEQLELRNNSGRLMDQLDFDDNHPWPVTPDGSGATLAKALPMTGSAQPENWTISSHLGGTPGYENFGTFDPTVLVSDLVAFGSNWNWSSDAANAGLNWNQLEFDDTSWNAEFAPVVAGKESVDLTVPEPITTLFNTGLDEDGEPLSDGRRDDRWLLTGTEEAMRTMRPNPAWLPSTDESKWIGIERSGTRNVDPGNYSFTTTFDLSEWKEATASVDVRVAVDDALDDILINGQSTGIQTSGFAEWNGPFTIDQGFQPGENRLSFEFTNGGVEPNPSGLRVEFAGTAVPLKVGQSIPNDATTYYFRQPFVYAGNPNADVSVLLDSFVDDGAVFYLNGQEIHRHNMPQGPIDSTTKASSEVDLATRSGQIQVASNHLRPGDNVLAVEVHRFGNANEDDVQFDAALVVQETPIPPEPLPPSIVFNEMGGASEPFWMELANLEEHELDLTGFQIRSLMTETVFTFGQTTIEANGLLMVDETMHGLDTHAGDQLFLYSPNAVSAIDGQDVDDRGQGRSVENDGRWLFTSEPTQGQPNQFAFHDEIVINEIQYHARPQLAIPDTPATLKANSLIQLNSNWLYDQSGRDLGADWHTTTYTLDDVNWNSGPTPIGFETGRAADTINTELDDPRTRDPAVTTYYFQKQFEFAGNLDQEDLQLQLAHLVDDGAVFYLNGAEIQRFNLPEGPINATTFANSRINSAEPVGPIQLPTDQLVVGTNIISVEVHQQRASDNDISFDATLSVTEPQAPAIPGRPFEESDEEWIELYNKSDHEVDLTGWKIRNGIRFDFPDGTKIGANEYLVLANDAQLVREIYPALEVAGEFDGTLSNVSDQIELIDDHDNPADSVRYYDGQNWPDMADGNGSTLELRDPDADNRRAESWAASDETSKSSWQKISYRDDRNSFPGTNDPSHWNELILGLLSAGEILIDDISVVEDPDGAAIEFIQNGSFDDGTDHYRMVGNHGAHGLSQIVPDPDDPSNPVLHLVATGFGEHMSNHVETTFVDNRPLALLQDYEVSYRVKWLSGSGQLNTRSYFNRMARTTVLEVDRAGGTPGAPNSASETNIGPTYQNLHHEPAIPNPGQDVSVFVEAADLDGVSKMTLWYSADESAWNEVAMSLANNQRYHAIIPGHQEEAVVQFYVAGTDSAGASSFFPAAGPDSRALFTVDDGRDLATNQHSFRIVMTQTDVRSQVLNTNVLSNHRLGATIITDDAVYYDTKLRIKGSGFGRGGSQRGYNIRFNPDDLFRGVHDAISIDRKDNQTGQGASHREIVHKHIGAVAGNLPELYDDLIYIIPPDRTFTGPAQLQMSRYDRDFLESSFENGSEGTRFEFELIYHSATTTPSRDVEGLKLPPGAVLGIDIEDLGDDKEAYRWNFLIKNHRLRDDYSQIIELGKTLSLTGSQNGSELDIRSQAVMDVDAWLRTFAYISLGGINDTYNQGLPHNLQFFVRPSDQRVLPLPWDQDFTFHHSPSLALVGSGSNLRKVLQIPNNLHHFYGHMYDMISTTYNTEYLEPWVEHYATFVRFDESDAILKYIQDRSDFVMRRLPDQIDFSIEPQEPIVVDSTTAALTGQGWVNVRDIRVQGTDRSLDVTWNDETTWELTLPVPAGSSDVTLEALNLQGEVIGTSTVQVTSTVTDRPLEQALRITEIMYNPAEPTATEIDAGHDSNSDFEFLELVNIGNETISLDGAQFAAIDDAGVTFEFSQGSIRELAPNATVLVVEDLEAFQQRYGDTLPVAGEWDGRLSDSGEQLTLQTSDQVVIQQFTYDDGWYPETDGQGESLVIRNARGNVAAWNDRTGWSPSGMPGGSPGELTGRLGDVNGDGVFNAADLTALFQTGEFEDGIEDNSTFAEGDFNGDGDFTSADLVRAFEIGGYSTGATIAARQAPETKRAKRRIAAVDEVLQDDSLGFDPLLPLAQSLENRRRSKT